MCELAQVIETTEQSGLDFRDTDGLTKQSFVLHKKLHLRIFGWR